MPARDTDLPIGLRKFEGVNQQLDSVYLGPSILRRSTNWVPAESYVLTKRNGSVAYQAVASFNRLDRIQRAYSTDELHRYLYVVGTPTAGTDALRLSTDDGAFATITNGAFAASNRRYDMAQLGNLLYVGNGVDPIKRIPLGGAAVDLGALGSFTDGSAAPTAAADTNAKLLSGTYSYAWAVLNHATGVWTQRGQAREVSKATGTDQHLSFPVATGYALAANERFHLFVAPVNLPVELAMDQFPEGVTGGGLTGPVILRDIQVSDVFLPLRGPARTGNKFATHRQRLWFAGWETDPTLVMATSLILPATEQPLFSQFDFYPVNAVLKLPAPVHGLAVATIDAQTSDNQTPQAPMAIFTRTRTFLYFGDIIGDASAQLQQVSGRIGCASQRGIAATPYGLVWPGLESVYLMPPGGGSPVDVGWPIAPLIKQIDHSRLGFTVAIFHRGFVKLAFSSPGSTYNDQIWWLDLRQGNVGQLPRWFGPHTGGKPSAYTVGELDPDAEDRLFLAIEGTGTVRWDDVPGAAYDGLFEFDDPPIQALLESGELDDNQPFDKKLWSRVRVTAQGEHDTSLQASLEDEDGKVTSLAPMAVLGNTEGARWDLAQWEVDHWGRTAARFRETQATTAGNRPASLRTVLRIQHIEPMPVSLRDVEVRYHPVVRPVRSPDTIPRA